ncbi:MAG: serine/threonine protein kinase [Planctomycetaceae bacterium]|nr:serine/threonine protein kinase [Planctomycetaceae bacterium]
MSESNPGNESGPPDTRLSDSTRKCVQCGELFSGELHFACLAGNRTVRGDQTPGRASEVLDELPDEAAAHAADPTRALHHYVLVRHVGRGGMGAVWKAWDRKLTRWVAIKFLLAQDVDSVGRFAREAKLAARLRHPNIAAIFEVGEAPSREAGQPLRQYLAMEFIDGKTLAESRLSPPQALAIFSQVARAVDSAHKGGVIHRDLKPQNIMVTQDLWPYVTDFGVAKAIAVDSSQSVSGSVVGTPAYMPPEQAEGRLSAIDGRSDVYSLGATMYAVLLGRPPFDGESGMEILRKVGSQPPPRPRAIDPGLPADVEAILLKAMAWNKEERYPTAAALADDIDRHLEGARLDIRIPSDPRSGKSGKGRALAAVAALLVLVAAGVGVAPRFLARDAPASPVLPAIPAAAPAPVATGTFTLKIAVHPYARIVSLSREGSAVALEQTSTPLLIPGLQVGAYELELSHPEFGTRRVSIPPEKGRPGKTVVVWGQMSKDPLTVTELP